MPENALKMEFAHSGAARKFRDIDRLAQVLAEKRGGFLHGLLMLLDRSACHGLRQLAQELVDPQRKQQIGLTARRARHVVELIEELRGAGGFPVRNAQGVAVDHPDKGFRRRAGEVHPEKAPRFRSACRIVLILGAVDDGDAAGGQRGLAAAVTQHAAAGDRREQQPVRQSPALREIERAALKFPVAFGAERQQIGGFEAGTQARAAVLSLIHPKTKQHPAFLLFK